ncbi:MAG: hypothetical protein M3O77_00350 [Chloroflexota bacterium]|nr:hypothetical protein [Chloroflexota bacterium]
MTTLLVPWLAFPLVLGALLLGCGLLLERASGLRLPGPLLLPYGLAVLIVIALFTTMSGATAGLTMPAVAVAAAAGAALSLRRPRPRLDGWALAAGVGVYAVYAAPLVLSGRATFAGYIKLDDDATFVANLDRAMHHGRSLAGLAPSSYLATLLPHLAKGYPLGAFMPIGVGREIVGGDSMWLYQPSMALFAALLGLSLYELTARLIDPGWLRGLAAFIGAQSALLYGYSLWGGIKEVGGASVIALAAASVVLAARGEGRIRSFLPLAAASAALLGMLSAGAVIWLAPPLAAAALAVVVTRARETAVRAVTALAVFLVVLSIPTLVSSPAFIASRIFEFDYLANLAKPLSAAQLVGVWPTGDFRFTPGRAGLTYALIAVTAIAAAGGLAWALRRGAWELPLYSAGAVVSCFAFYPFSTPWIDAKALATASTAVPVAALACCAPLFARGMRVEGAMLALVVSGAVLWSNVLQYHDVWLAPQAQLHELESIGNHFSGQGPSLMTEFMPYGVRHFLRKIDAEGASELRIRQIPLRDGQLLQKGAYANIDDFQLGAVLVYRTLVLRRSPAESRPPSSYRLVRKGRFYEVWQRPQQGERPILEHLPLGNDLEPAAVPSCADVLRLARVAGPTGLLAAVERPPSVVIDLSRGSVPHSWGFDQSGGVIPGGAGMLQTSARVPATGRYGLWLGGSFRDRLEILVDGRRVGTVRDQLNYSGQYTPFGVADLGPGSHVVMLRYSGPDLQPGSGGPQFAMGPLVLSTASADLPVTYVQPTAARMLCGRALDWVEAVGA